MLDQFYEELRDIPFIIFSGTRPKEVFNAVKDAYAVSPTFAKNFKGYVEKRTGSIPELLEKIEEIKKTEP
jgi:hypothetical protein